MKSSVAAMVLCVTVGVSHAGAPDELRLATSKGCLSCHDVTQTLAGPAYKDVANRYQATDEKRLIHKVLNGGAGAWGTTPMPANKDDGLTDEEARRLVEWILSLKAAQ